MNRFNPDELKALRRAALALEQSDKEVTSRLEAAYDQISFMLELIHDQSSTDTLVKVCDEIEKLIGKLNDTLVIGRLVVRERELEIKLAELDKQPTQDKVLGIKERILAMLKEDRSEEDPYASKEVADAETLQRIEERLQLESLIDSLYTSEAAERVKKMLKLAMKTYRSKPISIKVARPYRDLDVQVPTSKGEGYEVPDHPTD
jgi:hypothetical protein